MSSAAPASFADGRSSLIVPPLLSLNRPLTIKFSQAVLTAAQEWRRVNQPSAAAVSGAFWRATDRGNLNKTDLRAVLEQRVIDLLTTAHLHMPTEPKAFFSLCATLVPAMGYKWPHFAWSHAGFNVHMKRSDSGVLSLTCVGPTFSVTVDDPCPQATSATQWSHVATGALPSTFAPSPSPSLSAAAISSASATGNFSAAVSAAAVAKTSRVADICRRSCFCGKTATELIAEAEVNVVRCCTPGCWALYHRTCAHVTSVIGSDVDAAWRCIVCRAAAMMQNAAVVGLLAVPLRFCAMPGELSRVEFNTPAAVLPGYAAEAGTAGLSVRLVCALAGDLPGRCSWPENASLELNGKRLQIPANPALPTAAAGGKVPGTTLSASMLDVTAMVATATGGRNCVCLSMSRSVPAPAATRNYFLVVVVARPYDSETAVQSILSLRALDVRLARVCVATAQGLARRPAGAGFAGLRGCDIATVTAAHAGLAFATAPTVGHLTAAASASAAAAAPPPSDDDPALPMLPPTDWAYAPADLRACAKSLELSWRRRAERAELRGEADLDGADTDLSLVDPFTSSSIAIPVRGDTCAHVRCFDLRTYLAANKHRALPGQAPPSWRCPLCKQHAPPAFLWVDMLQLGIALAIAHRGVVRGDGDDMTLGLLGGTDATAPAGSREPELALAYFFSAPAPLGAALLPPPAPFTSLHDWLRESLRLAESERRQQQPWQLQSLPPLPAPRPDARTGGYGPYRLPLIGAEGVPKEAAKRVRMAFGAASWEAAGLTVASGSSSSPAAAAAAAAGSASSSPAAAAASLKRSSQAVVVLDDDSVAPSAKRARGGSDEEWFSDELEDLPRSSGLPFAKDQLAADAAAAAAQTLAKQQQQQQQQQRRGMPSSGDSSGGGGAAVVVLDSDDDDAVPDRAAPLSGSATGAAAAALAAADAMRQLANPLLNGSRDAGPSIRNYFGDDAFARARQPMMTADHREALPWQEQREAERQQQLLRLEQQGRAAHLLLLQEHRDFHQRQQEQERLEVQRQVFARIAAVLEGGHAPSPHVGQLSSSLFGSGMSGGGGGVSGGVVSGGAGDGGGSGGGSGSGGSGGGSGNNSSNVDASRAVP